MPDAEVRINLRPLASALPLGFLSFGIGMFLLGAQGAGWIPVGQAAQLGLVLAAFVFPLELLATIFAFLSRDVLSASALGLFSTSWLTLGLVDMTAQPGQTSKVVGFYLFAFTVAIAVLALVGFLGKPLISLLLLISAARALLQAIYEMSGTTGAERGSGYVALVIAGMAGYGGLALLLEDLRQRAVLPIARRGASQQSIEGDLGVQVARARQEAGVRQQL